LTTTSTTRASRSRYRQLTDEQWARIAPLLPSNDGKNGRPYADHRRVVEGIIYRYRTGLPWRDLPASTTDPGRPYGAATGSSPPTPSTASPPTMPLVDPVAA